MIEQPLAASKAGGSGSFLAEGSDERQWWVKPPNNLQQGKVIVTEHLVGSLGKLIGAPTCEVAIARIPEEIAGFEFRAGSRLEPGLAHASLAVEDAQESHTLDHRREDHNSWRHVGVYALFDWCWGGDPQWLYAAGDQQKLYSHDHGWYLPPEGPDWTESELMNQVDQAHEIGQPINDLSTEALSKFAARLNKIGKDDLLPILNRIPLSWPVSDGELETLGFFLERRAPAVATRLETLQGSTS